MSEEIKRLEPKVKGQAFSNCPVCHNAVSPKRGIEMTFEVEGEKYTDLYHPGCAKTVEAMVSDHTMRQYEEAKAEVEAKEKAEADNG